MKGKPQPKPGLTPPEARLRALARRYADKPTPENREALMDEVMENAK